MSLHKQDKKRRYNKIQNISSPILSQLLRHKSTDLVVTSGRTISPQTDRDRILYPYILHSYRQQIQLQRLDEDKQLEKRNKREHEHTKERGIIDQRFVIWKHEVYIDATLGQVIWTSHVKNFQKLRKITQPVTGIF